MSDEVFRRARKLARKISKGAPAYKLLAKEHQVKGKDVDGKMYDYKAVQAIVDPSSTRGVYLQIKKLLRRGISITDIENSAALKV